MKKIREIRYIIRVLLLALIVLGALFGHGFVQGDFCHLTIGPLSLSCPLGYLLLSLSTLSPMYSLLISSLFFIVVSLILGRVFCGWICPLGLVNEAINQLKAASSRKSRRAKRHPTRSGSSSLPWGARSIGRWMKYVFLASVIVVSVLFRYPVFCLICPIGILVRSLLYLASFQFVALDIIIVVAILLLELFLLSRGWCGSLCPLGALYSLLGQSKIVSLRVEKKDPCDKCRRCYEPCPMGLIPTEPEILDECSNCGLCKEICALETTMPRFLHPRRWKNALKRIFRL